jgi:glyoxylase-like metal-dependent hydrolase (beta-lactamase superfamily II)
MDDRQPTGTRASVSDESHAKRSTLPPPSPAARRVPRPASDARVEELLDGVWSLRLPLCYAATAHVNAYLLKSPGGWILVDCGSVLAPGWEALELALARAGASAAEVELLIVTHSHADHRGLADELVAAAGCGFAMGPPPHPQIDVLRDPTIELDLRRERGRREGVPASLLDAIVDDLPAGDGHHHSRLESDRVLHPGTEVETSHGRWQALAAPGHSADQIMLWNQRLGALIGADLALPGVASFLEYGTRPDPQADQVASLTRAIELEPALLLAGHGRPSGDPVAMLHTCRERVLERLDAVHARLGAHELSAWELVELVRPAKATADHLQRILSETLCVLEHLEQRERAAALIGEDGVRRWRSAQAPR